MGTPHFRPQPALLRAPLVPNVLPACGWVPGEGGLGVTEIALVAAPEALETGGGGSLHTAPRERSFAAQMENELARPLPPPALKGALESGPLICCESPSIPPTPVPDRPAPGH